MSKFTLIAPESFENPTLTDWKQDYTYASWFRDIYLDLSKYRVFIDREFTTALLISNDLWEKSLSNNLAKKYIKKLEKYRTMCIGIETPHICVFNSCFKPDYTSYSFFRSRLWKYYTPNSYDFEDFSNLNRDVLVTWSY